MAGPLPVIVWYRQDLRVADHAALTAAAVRGGPVIPVFIHDDDGKPWRPGGASRWWLHHALCALDTRLRQLGSRLVIRRGDTVDVLTTMVREHGAGAIFCQRRHEPGERTLETSLRQSLDETVELRRLRGVLLNEPERVHTGSGTPYRVFTPFYKAVLAMDEPDEPKPAPKRLTPVPGAVQGLAPADLDLLPTRPDWAGGLNDTWQPGEFGAHRRLEAFIEQSADAYRERRDTPGAPGTSGLSPHLHFGEISPRQLWHAVRGAQAMSAAVTRGGDAFLRELLWREFCHHLLYHWPQIPERAFNARFADFPWREDEAAYTAWCRGRTGYPLVDAGMRQLWHSGWMHNRVRMVAASFLVKHLLVPWQRGQAWFWDTLVDADLANNACGWQWVAGCGVDAAPYFRIFNPVLQGEKFDPAGEYVRRWVPELAHLPERVVHAPFRAKQDILDAAGVRLGANYSAPIVDHGRARERALEAFRSIGSGS